MTGFPILKGLVISNTTGNNGLVDREGTMRPADVEKSADAEGLADVKGLADIEKPILADIEKPIIICYKYQYLYK